LDEKDNEANDRDGAMGVHGMLSINKIDLLKLGVQLRAIRIGAEWRWLYDG